LVAGTRGSVTLPRLDTRHHGGYGWWTPIESERTIVPEEDPLTLRLRHFIEVVRGETEPLIDGREGTRTLETTVAVKRAAATGEVVPLS
jgi:predicted dehydrogenase